MQGPTGAKVSNPFARVYWMSFFCSSRAVTSLTHVMPKIYRCASSSGHATGARADDDAGLRLVIHAADPGREHDRIVRDR